MRADGVRRALVFATSATSSFSGCRQYRDDLAAARRPRRRRARRSWSSCGTTSTTPASSPRTPTVCGPRSPRCRPSVRDDARLVFTAHSIPVAMNDASGPGRERPVSRRSSARPRGWSPRRCAGRARSSTWSGSRGPGRRRCRGSSRTSTTTCARWPRPGRRAVVVSPTGFVSDHLEVLWDLDNEAQRDRAELGLPFARAATAGTHPAFVATIRELVAGATRRCRAAGARVAGPVRHRLPGQLLPVPPAPDGSCRRVPVMARGVPPTRACE